MWAPWAQSLLGNNFPECEGGGGGGWDGGLAQGQRKGFPAEINQFGPGRLRGGLGPQSGRL